MLKNHLLIAFRVITRNKTFAFLNIFGLGLGMACCLLIFIYVKDELSFDKFQSNYDRVYRVLYNTTSGDAYARVPPPISPLLPEQFAEVEASARLYPRSASVQIELGNGNADSYEENLVYFADSSILQILSFEFLAGNPEKALRRPFNVILTDEIAEKYFGSISAALGQQIVLQGSQPFTVEAIIRKYPDNSHINFNLLVPYENMYDLQGEDMEKVMRRNLSMNWVISHSYTYVLLKNGANTDQMEANFADLVKNNAPEQLQLGQTFILEPLKDFYLHSDAYLPPGRQGNMNFIYVFSGIALLTLLIACFNYINLATAQSVKRAREVGIRKVMGAWKSQLFFQFMGESLLIAFCALLFSLFLAALSLPLFNELTSKELSEVVFFDRGVLPVLLGVFLVTGLIGGSYPSFRISRANLLLTLKNKVSARANRLLSLRKILVVGQFMLSVTLIAGALIIYKQINFLVNHPLGFDKEAVMNVPLFSENLNNVFGGVNGDVRQRTNAFEEALLQLSEVKAVTLSSNPPSLGSVSRMTVPEGVSSESPIFVSTLAIDYDFIQLYGLEIVAGRDFDKNRGTDHLNAFIINETACERFKFGTPEEAIDKKISQEGKEGQVVGVVNDFEYSALRTPMNSALLHIDVARFNVFSIKVSEGASLQEAISSVNKVWEEHFPEKAFEYQFLDTTLEESFNNEKRLGKIIGIFAALAILVSCLGSYGLIMFSAKQREKEIGVRKVLGASFLKIVGLLFKEFTWLYLIGFVLGIPAAWYFTEQWLQDFNYRISLNADVFLLSGLITMLIVWITISFQSIKSANANPVKSLRSE